ncbi:hypothetical protein NFI96_021439 [Prochilodus magdalenae]|nr:hypothetical protein NFI96_021439 [Prochilodus magdalenae]
MAAGGEAVSGNSRGSTTVMESTLDRRFQGVSNTMESIQGLSSWCIENKKHHSVIVRSWIKWLRKSDAPQRLNLFYLANDVIQNCKRKNAIVYRTTFTDVLPEAIKLVNKVKDSQVRKSVERILSIWEERSVYSEELINQLRNGLVQKEEPPAPVNPKAALRSKIVAEFVPSTFVEQLTKYRNSMDEIELREKQLAAMRVDVCSTEALKKLKDKAGGKRFSKDFEDGSAKLQDFVAFLDGQVKKGPSLMEALENAEIFYEMQYKEVKIVTKAYQTFANRVLHLKRKLDSLKSSLPDPNDSPIPSPIEDAPSPTGSESPFHTLAHIGTPDPELDGQAMDEDLIALGDAPSPLSSPGDKDNRDVEDMELSDVEEIEGAGIIVEERVEQPAPVSESSETTGLGVPEPSQSSQATPVKQATVPAASVTPATASLPINLAGVDLGKISSILSTLSNVMKNSAVGASPASRSSTSISSTPTTANSSLKTTTTSTSTPTAAPAANPLASILSRVDFNPSTLLNALSKTQTQGVGLQGLSSLLNNQAGMASTSSGSDMDPSPDPTLLAHAHASPKTSSESSTPSLVRGSTPQRVAPPQTSQSPNIVQTRDHQKEAEKDKVENIPSANSSLDSKIDNFLQVNPGLRGMNLGFPSVLSWPKAVDSPSASTENLGGTPVRDESGATPTQDEVMDDPVVPPFLYQGRPLQTPATSASNSAPPLESKLSRATYTNDSWRDKNMHGSQVGTGSQNGGEIYQRDFTAKQDIRNSLPSLAEGNAGPSQHVKSLLPSVTASNNQLSENSETVERFGSVTQGAKPYSVSGNTGASAGLAADNWYGETYGDSQERRMASSEAYRREPCHSEEPRQELNLGSPSDFFNSQLPPLPPIPQLPPPPQDFLPPGVKDPVEHLNPVDKLQTGSNVPEYIAERPVSYDYDERVPHEVQAKEPFHCPMNMSGPRHHAAPPRFATPGPPNGPMVYNHRPRGPVHHQRPNMPHGRLHPPCVVRGYHEGPSPPQPQSEELYIDPYYNLPPRSSSPTSFEAQPPPSSQSHGYHGEDRNLPPHHPEHGLRPHLEHRPPLPHPYRASRPGLFPPQRPLRRPPPPHMPYSSEPQFQRAKRPGPPFAGPPRAGGVFYPPKRPFLPPRY